MDDSGGSDSTTTQSQTMDEDEMTSPCDISPVIEEGHSLGKGQTLPNNISHLNPTKPGEHNFDNFDMIFEHRREHKSCSACPKAQDKHEICPVTA